MSSRGLEGLEPFTISPRTIRNIVQRMKLERAGEGPEAAEGCTCEKPPKLDPNGPGFYNDVRVIANRSRVDSSHDSPQ